MFLFCTICLYRGLDVGTFRRLWVPWQGVFAHLTISVSVNPCWGFHVLCWIKIRGLFRGSLVCELEGWGEEAFIDGSCDALTVELKAKFWRKRFGLIIALMSTFLQFWCHFSKMRGLMILYSNRLYFDYLFGWLNCTFVAIYVGSVFLAVLFWLDHYFFFSFFTSVLYLSFLHSIFIWKRKFYICIWILLGVIWIVMSAMNIMWLYLDLLQPQFNDFRMN